MTLRECASVFGIVLSTLFAGFADGEPAVHFKNGGFTDIDFHGVAGVEAFLSAGYRKDQVMEVFLGVALKTISNYLDHISPTPLDQAFEAEKFVE